MNHLYSIRTKLTILLTLVVTIVYGVSAYINVGEKSEQLDSELHRQMTDLARVQVDALTIPLWNFDHADVERQLGVLVSHVDIVAASVIELGGSVFAIAGAPSVSSRHHDDIHRDEQGSGARSKIGSHIERDITDDLGEPIGRLVIELSHARIHDLRLELINAHLKEFLIITLVIAATIAIAVTSLIRPVLQITETMGKVADGDIEIAIPATDQRDEIGKMAKALEVFKGNAVQLQVALEKERELNGLQRQFVSMVSHEFRTPLAVIDGNAQQMLRRLERVEPARLRPNLEKVRISVVRLTELMESVLNASRLEEGRVAFDPGLCDLVDMLLELCGSYSDLNPDRKIHVDIDALPKTITADQKLLRQVFSNLLSNAIKYSPDGKNIWVTGTWQEHHELVVAVRDEGLGIPENELQKLFARFFRASTSTGIAGSGIGLHLVQHFIDLHEGRIEVESMLNVGTTFRVRLPVNEPGALNLATAV